VAVAITVNGPVTAFAFETLTVSTVSLPLTNTVYLDTTVGSGITRRSADAVFLTVETNPIRVRWDGSAPTAAVGHLLNAGDTLEIVGLGNIKNLRMIRSGAADGTIMASYLRL
jgi:hypothetical protein